MLKLIAWCSIRWYCSAVVLSAGLCTTIRAIDKKNGSVPVEVLRTAATWSRILKGMSVAINIIDKSELILLNCVLVQMYTQLTHSSTVLWICIVNSCLFGKRVKTNVPLACAISKVITKWYAKHQRVYFAL